MTGQTVRTRQEAVEHADSPCARSARRAAPVTVMCHGKSSLRSSKRIAAAGTGTMAHFDRVASLQQLPADGLRRPLKLASNLQNFQKIFLVFND